MLRSAAMRVELSGFVTTRGAGTSGEEQTKKLSASTARLCTVLHGSDIDALTP